MRRTASRWIGSGAVALAALLALAAGPCVEKRALEPGLGHIRVTLTDIAGVTGGDGSRGDPYDYPEGEVTFTFNAAAYDKQGLIMDCAPGHGCHEETATVQVYPGRTTSFPTEGEPEPTVQFSAGRVAGASFSARNLHGRSALLVIDRRRIEGEPVQGVLRQIPQYQVAGSHALGASRNVYFDPPRLRHIQIDDYVRNQLDIDYSALERRFVDIDCRNDEPAPGLPSDGHGKLVVTGIYNEGFYVTDVADAGQGFNHLYVYNYSYPEDLALGDRLDRLVGTSQDFSGATQISFPAWTRAMDAELHPEPFRVDDLDAVVEPALVTSAMCGEGGGSSRHLCGHSKQNWTLEALESARVRIEDVRTPDIFVDCDFNSNGQITFVYPNPDEETDCRDDCLLHDGSGVITAKEIVARPEVLQDIAVDGICTNDAQCASGQCGGYTDQTADDGLCRVVCPWEEAIEGIQPNCIQIRVPPQYICSELSTMRQFGQWTVALDDGGGPLVNLLTRETLVDFDPTAPEHLGMTIEHLQGNLRQVRAARPRWMVLVGLAENDVPAGLRP